MFKKFFVTSICCLLLWNIMSNVNGELTPFTLPEQEIAINKNIGENSLFPTLENLERIELKISRLKKDYYPLANLESQKAIINEKSVSIQNEAETILNSIDSIK